MQEDFSCGVVPYRVVGGRREFLLVRHRAGHWAFPKGHPDDGESDREAALRELHEETAIRRVELDERHAFEEQYLFTKRSGKRVHKRVRYYLGRVGDGQRVKIQDKELSDFAWCSGPGARERMSFDEGKALLDEVLGYLGEG